MNRNAAVLAALLLAACGGQSVKADQAFLDGAPDPDALMGSVTGDTSEAANALTSDGLGQQENALVTEPDYLIAVRNGVIGLNGVVRAALTPIVEIVKDNPDVATGTEHVWGPKDRGNATYRFTMKKVADKKFGWLLEGKAKGAADSKYVAVMAGGLRQGDLPHRGAGLMGINADALASIDSSIKARGKLLVGFAHGPNDGRALAYGLQGFTPNNENYQAVSARLLAVRGPQGATVVRMATYADISSPKNGTSELVLARVRWLPGVGGRADGLVFNGPNPGTGDVPTGDYLIVNSCWNAQLGEGYQKVRTCALATVNCSEWVNPAASDPSVCKSPEVLPPQDPAATGSVDPAVTEEGFDGTTIDPPTDIPDGTGSGL
jgi:hypothetical protein